MRKHSLLSAGLAAALAVTVAGCGSSESNATHASAPLSEAPVLAAMSAGQANATWRIPVTGMHCDGCASGIRSELQHVPGVAAAAVGFKESLAVVAVDTNKVEFATLAKVIADAGYQASPPKP